jgi:D-alanyl-D-alanine carboxypeptidase/D-alanyl-D-alanine-endopeptidase (penicillin-binding protein 4)
MPIAYLKRCIVSLASLISTPATADDFCSIDHALVSVYAVRADTQEVLIDQNSDLSLTPASCMKIATTAAALHILGADHRFATHLEWDGFIDKEKTLQGNLYIRGGGDPCLGSGRIAGSLPWNEQIQIWKEATLNLGIRRIEGKVIGDASKWETALAVPSWTWEDLGNYYGAGASALSFHENSYTLIFKPGKRPGLPAEILRKEPPLFTLSLQNEVKTGPEGSGDQACIYGSEFSPLQFVRGTVPAAVAEFSVKGAMPDPAAACADFLAESLQKEGIAIEYKDLPHQKNREAFHSTYSPTIGEIVHWTNRKSVNLFAEHLLKEMGFAVYNEGSTAAGIKAVTDFWRSQKIDLAGFKMVDGSGLSRKNLITAKQLVRMLLKMKEAAVFPIFFESLPEEKNGMRAKSGSMSHIKGYAGYVGSIVFAIFANQCSDHKSMNETMQEALAKLSAWNGQLSGP